MFIQIPSVTTILLDGVGASVRRVTTDLTTFIRAERLDAAEAEILTAMNGLRELRMHVRQLRAQARRDGLLRRAG